MERTYKVYMYVWKTGHRYVGRTYEGSKRIGCIKNYKSCPIVYNCWKENGKPHILILEKNIPTKLADEKERYYIKKFNSFRDKNKKYGLNLTIGGFYTSVSNETKEKQSVYRKENSMKYKHKFVKGMTFSLEDRQKMSEASTCKIKVAQYSPDGTFIKNYESTEQAARELNILPQNIGQNCLYKRSSAGGYIWRRFGDNPPLKINVKERMTNVILGKISYNEGLKASKETREKLSASHIGKSPLQKKIDQFTLDGEFIKTWNNIASAARSLNKNTGHISQAANGIRKSAYGYKWKFN